MKRIVIGIVCLAVLCVALSACGKTVEKDLWADALYTADTELGDGGKTLMVEVQTPEKAVTFTIHSDKETVGEALAEHGLVQGEEGAYGLYVKAVNGITADYDVDQSYWALTKNGESMMTGVDGAVFADGEKYELVYTK